MLEMDKDIQYMQVAIELAKCAYEIDETPIGAIVVYDDKIIGRGFNVRNRDKNPLGHAELVAIAEAAKYINDWRLEDCTMYVTVEPCQMCAGAIVQARIKRLVFGCENKKAGSCGSIVNLVNEPRFNHQVEVLSGVLREECSDIMKNFFKKMRIFLKKP